MVQFLVGVLKYHEWGSGLGLSLIILFRISSLKKRPGIYLNSGRPKTYSNQPLWTLEDGSPVLDLAKGRLDFIYGMDKGGFADDR